MFFVFFQTENLNQEEKEIYQKKMSTTTGTNEVPPWLSENNVKAVAAAAQSPIVQQATVNAINNGNINSVVNVIGNAIGLNQNQFTRLDVDSAHGSDGSTIGEIDPKEMAEIEIWIQKLRSAYTGVGVLMLLAAFFSLGTNNLATLFLAIYVWFFGLLILCVEIA